jgi:hypothetical protein
MEGLEWGVGSRLPMTDYGYASFENSDVLPPSFEAIVCLLIAAIPHFPSGQYLVPLAKVAVSEETVIRSGKSKPATGLV